MDKGREDIDVSTGGEYNIITLLNKPVRKCVGKHLYLFNDIANVFEKSLGFLGKKVTTFMFKVLLHNEDPRFKPNTYVYLIVDKDNKKLKVGRTTNMSKRYAKEVLQHLIAIENVSDVDKVENKLIREFKRHFEPLKGREYFKLNSSRNPKKLFDSIVKRFKVKNDSDISKHYKRIRNEVTNVDIHCISPAGIRALATLVFNGSDKEDKIISEITAIDAMYDIPLDKTNSLSRFNVDDKSFTYWIYYGYTVILNITDKTANISRLWKSICKAKKMSSSTSNRFDRFTKSQWFNKITKYDKSINIKKALQTYSNPLLNGVYLPIYFVHFVLARLNVEYAITIAKSVINQFLPKSIKGGMKCEKITGGMIENKSEELNKIIGEYFDDL